MNKNVITYIQLRVARQILNIGVRELANILRVSKATANNAELGKTRYFLHKHSPALIEIFKSHNLVFPNEYCIRYCVKQKEKKTQHFNNLTRFQLKAARCFMKMKQYKLAEIIHVNKNIISRAEQLQNTDFINPIDKSIIHKLYTLFYKNNINFPDSLSIYCKKNIDNKINL